MKKRGPSPAWSSELETIMRRWPYLPEHVQRTMVEVATHYGPPAISARFPTPAGAKWTDVEILLLTPEEAKISVGTVVRCYSYSALGLADGRMADRPRMEWRMLRTYAENPEPDAYYKLPKRRSLKVEISKFRLWLKGFFGLPEDPLCSFKHARWLPRFKIRADY